MAGQGIERREALSTIAIAAAASRFTGFVRWAFACAPAADAATQIKPAAYRPRFFTPAEYSSVELLTDIIIPNDGTPGALEAGVPEFIDFMVSTDRKLQYPFRLGLTWLDAHCRTLHGERFAELDRRTQTGVLEPLAYKDRQRSGEEDGRVFFRLMRQYTIMGFYTTRIGLEQLDYPGLRTYAASPECPHVGDPEHRGLAKRG